MIICCTLCCVRFEFFFFSPLIPSWYFGCQIIIVIVFHGQNSEFYIKGLPHHWRPCMFSCKLIDSIWNGFSIWKRCMNPFDLYLFPSSVETSCFFFLGAKIEFRELRKISVQSIVDLWSIKVLRLKMFQCAFFAVVVVAATTKQRFAWCVLHFYCFIGHSFVPMHFAWIQQEERKKKTTSKQKRNIKHKRIEKI